MSSTPNSPATRPRSSSSASRGGGGSALRRQSSGSGVALIGSLRGIGSLSPTALRNSDLLVYSPPMSPRLPDSPSPRSATDTLLHNSARNSPMVEPIHGRNSSKVASPRAATTNGSSPSVRVGRGFNEVEVTRRTSSSSSGSPRSSGLASRHASTHKRRASYSLGHGGSGPFDSESESPVVSSSPQRRDSGASSTTLGERSSSLVQQLGKSSSLKNLHEHVPGLVPSVNVMTSSGDSFSASPSAAVLPMSEDSLRTTATLIAGALQAVQIRRVTVMFVEGLGFDRHSVKLHLLGPNSKKVFSTKWSSKLRHPVWKQQSPELQMTMDEPELVVIAYIKEKNERVMVGRAQFNAFAFVSNKGPGDVVSETISISVYGTPPREVGTIKCKIHWQSAVEFRCGEAVVTPDEVRSFVLSRALDVGPSVAQDAGSRPGVGVDETLKKLRKSAPVPYSNWTAPMTQPDPAVAVEPLSSYMSLDAAVEWSGSPDPTEAPTVMDATTALNDKYQTVVETGDINGIVQISQDFISTALLIGRLIIDELHMPPGQRTLEPIKGHGRLGGRKYLHRGILFKFAIDDAHLFGQNSAVDPDWASSKVAGRELQALKAVSAVAESAGDGLCFPLMALIDYKGVRLVALSFLPVGPETLVLGSADAGATIVNTDADAYAKVRCAAKKLFLAEHEVGSSQQLLFTPVDLECHRGRDQRLYLLDYSRLMPAMEGGTAGQHLYHLFRPEFLQHRRVPLSSDAFSRFASDTSRSQQQNADAVAAKLYLLDTYLPAVCAQLLRIYGANQRDNFPLSDHLHRFGINMRHLGYVKKKLEAVYASERSDVAQRLIELVHVEACARAIKVLTRRGMRALKSNSEAAFYSEIVSTLNLAFGDSAASIDLWNTKINAILEGNFSFAVRADHCAVLGSIEGGQLLCLNKVTDMLGAKISKSLLVSLEDGTTQFHSAFLDFHDLVKVKPTVKHSNIVEVAKGVLFSLKARNAGASVHSKLRFYHRAVRHLKIALKAESNHVGLLLKLGTVITEMLQLDATALNVDDDPIVLHQGADEAFLRATEIDSANWAIFYSYAQFLEQVGDLEANLRYLQAILLEPTYPVLYTQYAAYLRTHGEAHVAALFERKAAQVLDFVQSLAGEQ